MILSEFGGYLPGPLPLAPFNVKNGQSVIKFRVAGGDGQGLLQSVFALGITSDFLEQEPQVVVNPWLVGKPGGSRLQVRRSKAQGLMALGRIVPTGTGVANSE